MEFKDNFSDKAHVYATARPGYPDELFAFLADVSPSKNRAWDCATGNGQAARELVRYFQNVIATDASTKQLRNAKDHERITYLQASAEQGIQSSEPMDIITVAQALHWFNFDRFYDAVRAVAAPSGVLAAWTYSSFVCESDLSSIVHKKLSQTILKGHWDSERRYVDTLYNTIVFPFETITAPRFYSKVEWTAENVLAYLDTWSSVRHYRNTMNTDPIELVRDEIEKQFDNTDSTLTLSWELGLLLGRVS